MSFVNATDIETGVLALAEVGEESIRRKSLFAVLKNGIQLLHRLQHQSQNLFYYQSFVHPFIRRFIKKSSLTIDILTMV